MVKRICKEGEREQVLKSDRGQGEATKVKADLRRISADIEKPQERK